ncbi:RL40-like protein [Mya arenaria]|uniref:RL40-like protein n=1 Tax=Mya arenaria TaxID=6604 RepID=A0ABY7F560_MYAAR|nr:uncharacterized protein LOC128204124 [Mya arenaria]XP_052761443.1 uncharacterized protein LOC128204124 [Mya arenaria]XP_052761444.1 uncharacterized protein LOC128204124 [Mya arenaria]XP_052761445.1 uncharacterized protein LOC128204124 [Mya arenaria]WAR17317.1 RL40-like protein [Mya arenaria]
MPGKEYQLFLRGLKGTTTRIAIDEDASIASLRKKCSDISGVPDDEMRVLYCSKELRSEDEHGDANYLEDYDIKDEGNLTLVLRLLGGSNEPEDLSPPPKLYEGEVTLTDKPDMFTLDDEKGGQRAEMPCGHVVGPESLTAWCRSLLSAGKFEFRCPYKETPSSPFCDRLWEFFTIKRLAVLTKAEIKEFETKTTENYLRKAVGIQDCPSCKSYCERKRKTDQRVICPICTKEKGKLYEFCWFCLKPWLTAGNGTKDCGNACCTGEDPRKKIIKDCPKKTVIGVPNCPAVRACPSCGLLIEHKDACKQMECPCGQKFCFICLQKANARGQYQCGTWNFKCAIAPIQTVIPGS